MIVKTRAGCRGLIGWGSGQGFPKRYGPLWNRPVNRLRQAAVTEAS
ncbi:hypothetical protein [Desulfovibrio inopinatus]|nr:hypothetical protein [Desulfovibrio inopinatus]